MEANTDTITRHEELIQEALAKGSANATAVGKIHSGQAGPLVAGTLDVAVAGMVATDSVVVSQQDKTGADATTTGYRAIAGAGKFTIEAYAVANGAVVAGDVTAKLNWIAKLA